MPRPNLTEKEASVLEHLAEAWNGWVELEARAVDDDTEMRSAIHSAQHLIALRVARRVDPHVWRQPNEDSTY